MDYGKVIEAFDGYVARGFSVGLGNRDGQMCVEAAICAALGEPHGDEPSCVEPDVRAFKIGLNDACWSSPEARAQGLRDLGVAQLGSRGVVNGAEFRRRLAEKMIRVLIPTLFRELFAGDSKTHRRCREAADRCEREGASAAAEAAALAAIEAARAAEAAAGASSAAKWAASAAAWAASAAAEAAAWAAEEAARAARAAAWATEAAARATRAAARATGAAARATGDKYLRLSASLALEVLRELGTPGVAYLGGEK